MARYVDGFLLPLPKKNLKQYKKMAQLASKVWKDHGALAYLESVLEDANATFAQPFPKGIAAKKGETVVLAWIVYKSRKHRDAVNAKVMKDPRLAEMMTPNQKMPFDCRRMLYGGFEAIVDV